MGIETLIKIQDFTCCSSRGESKKIQFLPTTTLGWNFFHPLANLHQPEVMCTFQVHVRLSNATGNLFVRMDSSKIRLANFLKAYTYKRGGFAAAPRRALSVWFIPFHRIFTELNHVTYWDVQSEACGEATSKFLF